MRARRAMLRIQADGNSPVHAGTVIPAKIRAFATEVFNWADLEIPLVQRADPALDLVNQLRSGLDEDGNLLTYGAAALYAGHVVDVLDDYFHYRHWSDDFAARERPARRAVTVVIDDAPHAIRPDSHPK